MQRITPSTLRAVPIGATFSRGPYFGWVLPLLGLRSVCVRGIGIEVVVCADRENI